MVDEGDPRQKALDQLAKKLVGSEFRTKLRKTPEKAAEELDTDNLPDGLIETLAVMSDDELKTVAIVQQQLNVEALKSSVSILF